MSTISFQTIARRLNGDDNHHTLEEHALDMLLKDGPKFCNWAGHRKAGRFVESSVGRRGKKATTPIVLEEDNEDDILSKIDDMHAEMIGFDEARNSWGSTEKDLAGKDADMGTGRVKERRGERNGQRGITGPRTTAQQLAADEEGYASDG